MASVLILAHLFKDQLAVKRQYTIRLWSSLALVATSSFYNVIDFNESLYYPLVAALIAALGVIVGIGLRVRIYLYVGFCAFLLNSLAVLVHVIRSQPESQIKLLIGVLFLIIGMLFTGSFLLFQMKRQQILNQYARLVEELKAWE